ncbi:1-phosphofructokinase family hexose kinase [Anaerorhabdus sp.]|uniref:1-phosphofructokinase family hexose kinase n=1 Tax=Anaerorhabdus sp. TaxID=1872524 RepID=UPI002B1FD5C2|nr:1-phosphofructokinase family hexose kinase [Anaerorhabdus sp.]MEA4875842.1 1-phosphofructokinase family hexose kinase [Anaerorhabdus sp.]
MIHTVTLNPSLDKTAKCDSFEKGNLNRIEITSYDVGGKGINASKTIRALNGVSTAYAILGGAVGATIKDVLETRYIPLFTSTVEQNTRINLKVIDKKGSLTEFNELGPHVDKKNITEIVNALKANVKPLDVVILAGSVPNGINSNVYQKMIIEVKKLGALVILDTSGEALIEGIKSCPTIIKPNRRELAECFGEESLTITQCIEKAKELIKTGIVLVVVSLGKEGALFVTKDNVYLALPIHVETKSSVGAGDAMVGAIAYGYDQRYTLEEIMKLSMAAATGAVTTVGTKPAEAKYVKQVMKAVVLKKK